MILDEADCLPLQKKEATQIKIIRQLNNIPQLSQVAPSLADRDQNDYEDMWQWMAFPLGVLGLKGGLRGKKRGPSKPPRGFPCGQAILQRQSRNLQFVRDGPT